MTAPSTPTALHGLVQDCQRDLARYLVPDSGISPEQVISQLLDRLDGPQAREAMSKVDLLSSQEGAALFKYAEETWSDLKNDDLGGFSGGNRPFWLLHAFKQVIETFGRRDVGLHHTQNELEAIGAFAAKKPQVWDTIDTAPHDGRWFLVLLPCSIVGAGKPCFAIPELKIIHRFKSVPESLGCWMSSWGNSVADSYVSKAMWAELDALPFAELYAAAQSKSLSPLGLPQPFGTGRPL